MESNKIEQNNGKQEQLLNSSPVELGIAAIKHCTLCSLQESSAQLGCILDQSDTLCLKGKSLAKVFVMSKNPSLSDNTPINVHTLSRAFTMPLLLSKICYKSSQISTLIIDLNPVCVILRHLYEN